MKSKCLLLVLLPWLHPKENLMNSIIYLPHFYHLLLSIDSLLKLKNLNSLKNPLYKAGTHLNMKLNKSSIPIKLMEPKYP
jgi:hypothetical protein